MTNAAKFKQVFGFYATELWAKPEKEFLEWLNAEPDDDWIECSERLPDQYGNYLISIDGDEPDIGTINPNNKRGWSLCDANGFYWAIDKKLNVTAWKPLPTPYKPKKHKEKTSVS